MKRHFRLVAALLALVAFSVSFAETVWATTCAPMDRASTMEMAPAHTAGPAAAGEAEAPEHTPPPSQTECPLTALAATGCVVISVPSVATDVDFAPSFRSMNAPLPAGVIDRVTAAALFRPPRP